ncbi:hypothetical protein EDD27_7669 [Nonomuraea polychroma]|uniref:Uncharacterized protein n=2 Tax=Nonomuraea polychroma TaxID=46176 RepID=A0A438MGE6_9ACTN|nr:hypothetical protein EDD27_7669 [Nonomuraea polychroma]
MIEGPDGQGLWGTKARLFIVSYAPLIGIFAARSAPHWWWTASLSILAVAGAVDGWRMVRSARKRSTARMKVTNVEDQGNAVSGYLATYLLPFLSELPSGWGDGIAYFLYFATAFVIFLKSNLGVVNPTLYVLGWRVSRVALNGRDTLLVSRKPVKVGESVHVAVALGVHVTVSTYGTIGE